MLMLPFGALMSAASSMPLAIAIAAEAAYSLVVDPSYQPVRSGSSPSVQVLSAYQLELAKPLLPVGASSIGASPVFIRLSDGTCVEVVLGRSKGSPGTIQPAECSKLSVWKAGSAPKPPKLGVRFINASAGFAAWRDERAGQTLITNMWNRDQVIFSTPLDVLGVSAIRSPDTESADLVLVGKYRSKGMVVLNSVQF